MLGVPTRQVVPIFILTLGDVRDDIIALTWFVYLYGVLVQCLLLKKIKLWYLGKRLKSTIKSFINWFDLTWLFHFKSFHLETISTSSIKDKSFCFVLDVVEAAILQVSIHNELINDEVTFTSLNIGQWNSLLHFYVKSASLKRLINLRRAFMIRHKTECEC